MKKAVRYLLDLGMGISACLKLPAAGCPDSMVAFLAALFYRTPDRFSMIQAQENAYTLAVMLHQSVRWVGLHMPVFRPSPALFSMLALTDAAAIPIPEIRLPFDPFVVEVPIDWRSEFPNGIQRYQIVTLTSFRRQRSNAGFTLDPRAQEFPTWWVQLIAENGGEIHHWGFTDTRETVGDWARARFPEAGKFVPNECPLDTADESIIGAAINVAAGLALYITEHDKGRRLATHTRKRKSARTANRFPEPEIYVLGDAIQVDQRIIASASEIVSARHLWTLRRRHVVRGHWRNQVCGLARSERRRTWIAPYWKGPEDGEKLSHVYEAEGPIR